MTTQWQQDFFCMGNGVCGGGCIRMGRDVCMGRQGARVCVWGGRGLGCVWSSLCLRDGED